MNRKDRKPPWILTYMQRKHTSRKYKDTEKQIKLCRQAGDWSCVVKLGRLLRRVWWGVRRYK
jgi:hypothetical protein